MAFDLKKALGTLAPTIATMLGGPLAGGAVLALEKAFGFDPAPEATMERRQEAIIKVVQSGGMTPEIIAAVRKADQEHAETMGQQGIDLVKLNNDHAAAAFVTEVEDRKDARRSHSDHPAVWWIAVIILVTFALCMGAVLYGSWQILQGGITIKDVAVVAAISGLIGSVVGYVAANAQTVINFIFGGSLGSRTRSDQMSTAVQQVLANGK